MTRNRCCNMCCNCSTGFCSQANARAHGVRLCFCFPPPHQSVATSGRCCCGGQRPPALRLAHAVGLREALTVCGGQRLTEKRCCAVQIGRARGREGQEAGSERPGRGCGQEGRPTSRPRQGSCRSQKRGTGAGLSSRKLPHEVRSFGAPAATDPYAQDDQAAPARPLQLRVGALLGSACKRRSSSTATDTPRLRRAGQRRDKRSAHRKLHTAPERQPVGKRLCSP